MSLSNLVQAVESVEHLKRNLSDTHMLVVSPSLIKLLIDALIAVVQQVLNLIVELDSNAANNPVVKALTEMIAMLKSLGL